MKLVIAACLSAVLALAAFMAAPAGAKSPEGDAASGLVLTSFRNWGLPGGAAVFLRGDSIDYLAFGKDADGRQITSSTKVYIGSLSKAFTAAAVLQLVERGKVELDAPAGRYLPGFRLADARGAAITVRHLMNQTSGMTDQGYAQWASPQPRTLEELPGRLANVRLASAPGARFSYHNPNYELLARLVETVSGEPFADYMKRHVFDPLGMTNTSAVDTQDEARDGAARGYISAFGRYVAIPTPRYFIGGAGGVVTTPRDYARWLAMQMKAGLRPDGERFLSADTIRLSQTPAPTSAEYGFGWNRRGERVSHSGGLPTYGAYAAIEGDAAVAVFAPVVHVAAPTREIGLAALTRLQGEAAAPIGPNGMWWIDFLPATAIVVIWASCIRALLGARAWTARFVTKPVWRRVLAFAPHGLIIAGVVWGVPFAVSRVMSWAWLWYFAYLPVWTLALWSAALAAALTASARIAAIALASRQARRQAA